MAKNFIELNGKRYDAVSGKPVDAPVTAHSHPKTKPLVDNFVRQTPAASSVKSTVADIGNTTTPHRAKATPQHITAHRPEHPKTLMRRAVQKPTVAAPVKLKTIAPRQSTSELAKPTSSLHKLSVSSVDQSRLERAQNVSRYGAINRFSKGVTAPPAAAQTVVSPYNPPVVETAAPAPQRSQALFDKAMANATSHQETYNGSNGHRGLRRSHVAIVASAFALIFTAGFLMYHSIPSMDLSVASAKAGFHASLPGYQPPGFSLGHFAYGPGSVTVNYHSNSDDRKFSVTERTSTWDSAALLTNFVKITNQQYQTFQVSGRTVYLYGSNNATWVDGGIWYVVNGNTGLSANQVIKMAGSI